MIEIIEISSQIAGILSLIVAIIGIIFIKPIYNYFKNNIKVDSSKNETKVENHFNGPVFNYGEGFNQKILNKEENLLNNDN